jgi:hypothetical protein
MKERKKMRKKGEKYIITKRKKESWTLKVGHCRQGPEKRIREYVCTYVKKRLERKGQEDRRDPALAFTRTDNVEVHNTMEGKILDLAFQVFVILQGRRKKGH